MQTFIQPFDMPKAQYDSPPFHRRESAAFNPSFIPMPIPFHVDQQTSNESPLHAQHSMVSHHQPDQDPSSSSCYEHRPKKVPRLNRPRNALQAVQSAPQPSLQSSGVPSRKRKRAPSESSTADTPMYQMADTPTYQMADAPTNQMVNTPTYRIVHGYLTPPPSPQMLHTDHVQFDDHGDTPKPLNFNNTKLWDVPSPPDSDVEMVVEEDCATPSTIEISTPEAQEFDEASAMLV